MWLHFDVTKVPKRHIVNYRESKYDIFHPFHYYVFSSDCHLVTPTEKPLWQLLCDKSPGGNTMKSSCELHVTFIWRLHYEATNAVELCWDIKWCRNEVVEWLSYDWHLETTVRLPWVLLWWDKSPDDYIVVPLEDISHSKHHDDVTV